jgi:hypothetical protein
MELSSDWKFWSFLVALLALILSQIPPVHILLRKAKLDVEIYSRVFINHLVGDPSINIHLILRNIGGRNLRIKSITANLYRDDKLVMTLPAKNYTGKENTNSNMNLLLTRFDIPAGEEWSHSTNFLNFFDRNDERKFREAEINLKKELVRVKTSAPAVPLAEASEEFIKPFNDMLDSKFNWLAGDYILEIDVRTIMDNVSVKKKYRFTVFESNSDDLKNHSKGYPSGDGIYWWSNNYKGTNLEVEEM